MGVRKQRTDIRDSAGKAIKEARQYSNVSQVRLAQLLGVSQPLVSSWECGKVTPGIDDVARIETVLNYTEGELLFRIAYPKNDPNSEMR